MFLKYLSIFGIALLPFVELRLAIPIGISMNLLPFFVFIVAVLADILLGFILIEILSTLDTWISQWNLFGIGTFYQKVRTTSRKKLHRFVKKYGVLGVALFIAIPLPGSGVYTGTLGAFLIGLDKKHYRWACVLGVVIAALIVTLLSVGVAGFIA